MTLEFNPTPKTAGETETTSSGTPIAQTDCKVFVVWCKQILFSLFNSSWLTKLHFQCGVKGSGGEDYIIGGEDTEENEYPWQVKWKQPPEAGVFPANDRGHRGHTGDTGMTGLTVGTFVSDFSGDILKFLRLFKSMPFDWMYKMWELLKNSSRNLWQCLLTGETECEA